MGYSHYWLQLNNPTDEQWDNITDTIKKAMVVALVTGKPFPIQRENSITAPPEISSKAIIFNGIYADSHETFYLGRNIEGEDSCKTNRKPYDFAVMVCLILAEHFAPDCWKVSSDGVRGQWQLAADWLNASGLGQFSIPKGI